MTAYDIAYLAALAVAFIGFMNTPRNSDRELVYQGMQIGLLTFVVLLLILATIARHLGLAVYPV